MAVEANNNFCQVLFLTLLYEIYLHPVIFCSILNIEELKNINFGLEIVNKPVIKGKSGTAHSVYLSSRYGQQYECTYEDSARQDLHKEQQERIAMEMGIPQLLQPMHSGPCLKKTIHWWTYEVCFGKQIRQYHIDGDVLHKPVIQLGIYESQFDWSNETAQKSFLKGHRLSPYHAQYYTNGSQCDLTLKARTTEVRFLCEEGTGDYIHRVDEPQPCVYVIVVRTTRVCHHPYLSPQTRTHAVPITCRPMLSSDEFAAYTKSLEIEQRRQESEEKNMQILKEQMKKKYSGESSQDDWVKSLMEDDTKAGDTKAGAMKADATKAEEIDVAIVGAKDNKGSDNLSDLGRELNDFEKLFENAEKVDGQVAPDSLSAGTMGKNHIKVRIRTIPLDEEPGEATHDEEGISEDNGSPTEPSQTTPEKNLKIEIVSARFFDEQNGEVRILSRDDNNRIRKVISALLGDTSEAENEAQRHNNQEVAYKYNWKHHISPPDDSETV